MALPLQQQAVPNPSGVSNDEVDLRQIVGALSRNINIIAAFAGTTLLLGGIYAFTRKDVWQANFRLCSRNKLQKWAR